MLKYNTGKKTNNCKNYTRKCLGRFQNSTSTVHDLFDLVNSSSVQFSGRGGGG